VGIETPTFFGASGVVDGMADVVGVSAGCDKKHADSKKLPDSTIISVTQRIFALILASSQLIITKM
jgi:ribonuclease HIII